MTDQHHIKEEEPNTGTRRPADLTGVSTSTVQRKGTFLFSGETHSNLMMDETAPISWLHSSKETPIVETGPQLHHQQRNNMAEEVKIPNVTAVA